MQNRNERGPKRSVRIDAARLRRTRTEKAGGLTQEALAERAGISVDSVRRAEHGTPISLETAQAIGAALDVLAEELLDETPSPACIMEFKTPAGSYRKEGDVWTEYPPYAPGRYNTFKEHGRDDDYIYLVDQSRVKSGDINAPMMVRLPLRGGSGQWSFPNPIEWKDFTVAFLQGQLSEPKTS
jgi:transcriptional regulator with XRE-family HTH domain